MLAYVFSHRPAHGVDVADYEETLRRFHAALAAAPSGGFLGSSTFRVGGRYSDWYLVENSAALDLLNAAAISGGRTSAHDAAARMAADGVGKLYSLVSGEPSSDSGFEIHFPKPAQVAYAELYERLRPYSIRAGTSLWRRMMVLGPPPEFCFISPSAIELTVSGQEVLQREPV